MYAQVAVNVPQVQGEFDYHIPADLLGRVKPGCLVTVPFGKQTVQGVVLRFVEDAQVPQTRPLETLVDSLPVVTSAQMELAGWMADNLLAPVGACLDLMLPPGLSQQADTLYRLNPLPVTSDDRPLSPLQERIISALKKRGDLRGRQLDVSFAHQDWRQSAAGLARRGLILAEPFLPPPGVRPRTIRKVRLAISPAEADARIGNLGRAAAGDRRDELVRFLINENEAVDAAWAYAASGCNLQDLHALADLGVVELLDAEVWRDPLADIPEEFQRAPLLTPQQSAAWDEIRAALDAECPCQPFLLQGVTGSGKTEIYLRAVEHCLSLGRQAIVLVPEIALTPQTVQRFTGRFPGKVGLIHSRLSAGERYDTWRRIRAGMLPVIIGPRSALFSPLPSPGLIVLDECHDDSYYQGEAAPHYHAVACAEAYARQTGSLLVYGSATPQVDLRYRAEKLGWRRLELNQRILAHRKDENGQILSASEHLPLPDVTVVDMRQELKANNRSIFSRTLQKALSEVLERRQQAILFLNRRGSATYVFCRNCGYVMRCPRCDLPLTCHMSPDGAGRPSRLICHTCAYQRNMPAACPDCESTQIRQYGAGTEKVEAEMRAMFPQARCLRWDAETTRAKGAHAMLLSQFATGQADILIGTQMLAKGLDLPMVTLVGVVLADVGLTFPDYRAGERTFQLLTQVAGRAGRSELGGRVVMQTFQPDHPVIRAAQQHDYEGFYTRELEQRRAIHYPPFHRLLRLESRNLDPEKARKVMENAAAQIKSWIETGGHVATELIGPAPCFFGRVKGYHRWQLIIRGPDPTALLRGRRLEDVRIEVDPVSLL